MEPELRLALDEAQRMRWWQTQLPPALERCFTEETTPARLRQFSFWVVISMILNLVAFGLDAISMPDMLWLAVPLRFGVLLPVGLIAWRLLRRPRRLWVGEALTVMPPHLAVLTTLILFGLSTYFDLFRSSIVLGFALILVNVFYPLRVPQTLLFTLIVVTIGDTINLTFASWQGAGTAYADLLIMIHIGIVMSLLARCVAERDARFNFMRGLALQIRADDLMRSNVQLLEMSSMDALTGLANRRHFDATLEQAWQEAVETGSALAVLMIDVDQFKLFNDAAGHLEGDRCLAAVAGCLADQVRKGRDLAARFGGEEFVVMLPATDLEGGRVTGERIRTAIAALQIVHPGRAMRGFVSASIGVAASWPAMSGGTPTLLLAAADAALYEAKAGGRNCVVCAGTVNDSRATVEQPA